MDIKSREFRNLQREWYDKLAATGHIDIEYGRSDPSTQLARHHQQDLKSIAAAQNSGAVELCEAAGQLPNHATFSSMLQRVVSGLLNEGIPKSGIKAGLSACRRGTGGAIHWAIETVYGAARELAGSGRLHEGEDDSQED